MILFGRTQTAIQTPFEPERNPDQAGEQSLLTSVDTQNAIEELSHRVEVSASPGFTWGRSGSGAPNTYLLNDSVPSNLSGRTVFLYNASITRIFVANQNATAGIGLNIYSHDGNGVALTLLGVVTTAAVRTNTFVVDFPVAQNKQIAVRLSAGSASSTNIVVGMILKGTITP